MGLITTLGLIGTLISIFGGTGFLASRGRPGMEWENPGWLSGLIYSYALVPWGMLVIIFIEPYAYIHPEFRIIYQAPALLSIILISLSVLIRKTKPENKLYTSIPHDRNGSIRHSPLCTFFYLTSLIVLTVLSMLLLIF